MKLHGALVPFTYTARRSPELMLEQDPAAQEHLCFWMGQEVVTTYAEDTRFK
jgi:hypothetical protein